MPIDFNYGRRTGVTTFKHRVALMCNLFRKFQPEIENWINTSTLGSSDKTNLLAIISAINTGCDSAKRLPDD